METDLANAIAAGQLEVWYQPLIESASIRIAGFEALARWRHPQRGLLTPDSFAEAARESAVELAAWVLTRACADAAQWPGLTVSVNIPPSRFADADFPGEIARIATFAGFTLDLLELEILESTTFADPDSARHVMRRLRDMGVQIAIDDFGQGYSRESLLLDLPVTKIKLARSIVADEGAANWIGEFVATAHALGMAVTAEGVETKAQAVAMRALGCDYLQGFYFGRPAPGADVTRTLSTFRDAT